MEEEKEDVLGNGTKRRDARRPLRVDRSDTVVARQETNRTRLLGRLLCGRDYQAFLAAPHRDAQSHAGQQSAAKARQLGSTQLESVHALRSQRAV